MIMVILCLVLGMIAVHWLTIKPKNFPPGPRCVPFMGTTPFLSLREFRFYLEKIAPKYGPLVGFKIGWTNVVGVAGLEETRRILKNCDFQGRSELEFPRTRYGRDFENEEKTSWTSSTIDFNNFAESKNFRFEWTWISKVVLNEIEHISKRIAGGETMIQAEDMIFQCVANITWTLISDDQKFRRSNRLLEETKPEGEARQHIERFEILLSKSKEVDYRNKLRNLIWNFLEQKRSERKIEFDSFLSLVFSKFSYRETNFMMNFLEDVFWTESKSIANQIQFGLIHCVRNLEFQAKLLDEIACSTKEQILDGTHLLNENMFPKIKALLSEVKRCDILASVSVPHKTHRNDVTLNSYHIPKGTVHFINVQSLLDSKRKWRHLDLFLPERFLDESGNFKETPEWKDLFELGQDIFFHRFPVDEITFLFLIFLFKKFEITPSPKGNKKPEKLSLDSFIRAPQDFLVKVNKRN